VPNIYIEIPLPHPKSAHKIISAHLVKNTVSLIAKQQFINCQRVQTLKMCSAPVNNPLLPTGEDDECIWGGEVRRGEETTASAPPASSESFRQEGHATQDRQTPLMTPLHFRAASNMDERQSALGSTSKPPVVEHIPASSQRWQTKEKPSEEENIQRLFESIGHLSITGNRSPEQ
jgi:hypothetical protein